MGTANYGNVNEQELGIIPRVIMDVFEKIEVRLTSLTTNLN